MNALLDAAAVRQQPGIAWCRAWSDRVDTALRGLLGDRGGVAVVALGGYARRELCPASDIDLVLLHDGWRHADLQGLVETLCYPLWDARLSVGHAVRTPAEAVADAGRSVDASTAVLDRRLVAGDTGLADALSARVRRTSRRRAPALLRQLAAADDARHRDDGAHPGMLEPNLKNGAGGLRDIHSLRWAAGWLLGECGLDPLVAAGYLGAEDRRRLGLANETLLAARCALHQRFPARGKGADVLRLDQQDEVAALLQRQAPDAVDADDLLLQVGLAARLVAHLHGRTWELVLSDVASGRRRRRPAGREVADGVHLEAGLVDVDPSATLDTDPAVGLRAVAVAATTGARLSRRTATSLFRQLRATPQLPWSDSSRKALLTLLHAGTGAADGLAEADHVGLLAAHLPEWKRVRGRPQRNPLHRFDLDTHGAQTVVELHALRRDDATQRLWKGLDDPDSVVLASWLHDIGKAWPGDHSVVGADVAGRWLEAMGFPPPLTTAVAILIRHHLLLPDVATRRDLDDDSVIAGVAATVGDAATLDALYLLSLADSRATGPAAWSPWKDDLMTTLHARVGAMLRGGSPTAPDVAGAEQAAVHAALLEVGVMPQVDVRPGRVDGTTIVSVVAQDRRRLLADCAGALAAADLAVVEARAVTTPEGIAADWFTVTGAAEPDALRLLLLDVVGGRVDVAERLARPRRRPPAQTGWIPHHAARVTLRDDTTIEVEAADRPALLFSLCRALDNAGLEIVAVRAATLGPTVFDVFEVASTVPPGDFADLENQLLAAAQGTG